MFQFCPHRGHSPRQSGRAQRGQGQVEQHGVAGQGLEVQLVAGQRIGVLVRSGAPAGAKRSRTAATTVPRNRRHRTAGTPPAMARSPCRRP